MKDNLVELHKSGECDVLGKNLLVFQKRFKATIYVTIL